MVAVPKDEERGPPWVPGEEEKERVRGTVEELVARLSDALSAFRPRIVPVGSTAKDTFLPGDSDIDIYVVVEDPEGALEVARSLFPEGRKKPGALRIWNFRFRGFDVDLVFVRPDDPKVDTMRHTLFFREHLTEEARNEVRRAKAFFKSRGLYGAEIGGITGVALEELVRRYGTLEEICGLFLEKNPQEIWLQDPVLERPRNLLASINEAKAKRIVEACREFLETGTFEYKRYTEEDFRAEHAGWHFLECERRRDRAADYSIALSACTKACNELRAREPEIRCECEAFVGKDKIVVAFDVEPEKLPPTRKVCIPKKYERAIRRFLEAHPDVAETYERDGYFCARVPRSFTEPVPVVKKRLLERMRKEGYTCTPGRP